MLYLLCILFPPLAVLLTGRIGTAVLNLLLTALFWVPGMIHAFFVVNDAKADQRINRMSRAVREDVLNAARLRGGNGELIDLLRPPSFLKRVATIILAVVVGTLVITVLALVYPGDPIKTPDTVSDSTGASESAPILAETKPSPEELERRQLARMTPAQQAAHQQRKRELEKIEQAYRVRQ